jgi:hypothetical protein
MSGLRWVCRLEKAFEAAGVHPGDQDLLVGCGQLREGVLHEQALSPVPPVQGALAQAPHLSGQEAERAGRPVGERPVRLSDDRVTFFSRD